MHKILLVEAGSTIPSTTIAELSGYQVEHLVLESIEDAVDWVADLAPTLIVVFAREIDEAAIADCRCLKAAFGTRAPPLVVVADSPSDLFRKMPRSIDIALSNASPPSLFARRIMRLSTAGIRVGGRTVVPDIQSGRRQPGPLLLQRVLYVSRSLIDGPSDGNHAVVAEIVENSRHYNAANGISGALAHAGGYFIQALEGTPPKVARLLDVIRQDTRHFDMRVRQQVATGHRLFRGWSMIGRHCEIGGAWEAGKDFAPFDADPESLIRFLLSATAA